MPQCSRPPLHFTFIHINFCKPIRNFRPKQGNVTNCILKKRLSWLQALSTLYSFPFKNNSRFPLCLYNAEQTLQNSSSSHPKDKKPHIYVQETDYPSFRDGKKMNTLEDRKDSHTWSFGRSFQDGVRKWRCTLIIFINQVMFNCFPYEQIQLLPLKSTSFHPKINY